MDAAPYIANLLLPGSGLVARGHLAIGFAALVAALLAISVGALAAAGVPGFDAALIAADGVAYVALALVSDLGLWAMQRRRRIDPVAVRAAHREAASAYLRNDLAAAAAAAVRLTRLAPLEPGAWDLLALVAGAKGDARGAAAAGKRARAIERAA